jgi:histidyl-tRNA synthetase
MIDTGSEDTFVIDPSITRGLDYYTGIVFETFLNYIPAIGSVCSGGRYDNLTGLYSKEALSGVGSSIGLDRLLAALEALDKIANNTTYSDIIIACLDESKSGAYQQIAQKLRARNIACEVFLEPKKLSAQFALAEKKGLSLVLVPSENNPADGPVTIRDLKTRQNTEGISLNDVAAFIQKKNDDI